MAGVGGQNWARVDDDETPRAKVPKIEHMVSDRTILSVSDSIDQSLAPQVTHMVA